MDLPPPDICCLRPRDAGVAKNVGGVALSGISFCPCFGFRFLEVVFWGVLYHILPVYAMYY